MSYVVSMLSDASVMRVSLVECQCDTGRESSFWWPCCQTLISVIWEEGTMASAEMALVCGLKVRVGCQDRLCVNSDADETLALWKAHV